MLLCQAKHLIWRSISNDVHHKLLTILTDKKHAVMTSTLCIIMTLFVDLAGFQAVLGYIPADGAADIEFD